MAGSVSVDEAARDLGSGGGVRLRRLIRAGMAPGRYLGRDGEMRLPSTDAAALVRGAAGPSGPSPTDVSVASGVRSLVLAVLREERQRWVEALGRALEGQENRLSELEAEVRRLSAEEGGDPRWWEVGRSVSREVAELEELLTCLDD